MKKHEQKIIFGRIQKMFVKISKQKKLHAPKKSSAKQK